MPTLITGAAGNLGSLLARHLLKRKTNLHLMIHHRELPADLGVAAATVFRADLALPETLRAPCEGVDALIHFAGVLFKPDPERFLPETNTRYFRNLVDVAMERGVKRIVLVSFPHVEGESTQEQPATGRLDGRPDSVHARTRGDEERYLFEQTAGTATTAISLRLGMVYGRGILMIDGARWLAQRRLLAVWPRPTWIQLISTPDYLRAAEASLVAENAAGVYHVGDEKPVTLQHFLDRACDQWRVGRPWRLPLPVIQTAAGIVEATAAIFGTPSPLTRDFVRIGTASYWGETARMRKDLLPELEYRTLDDGIGLL